MLQRAGANFRAPKMLSDFRLIVVQTRNNWRVLYSYPALMLRLLLLCCSVAATRVSRDASSNVIYMSN